MIRYSQMTQEQKREIRKERKRKAKLSRPLTPEERTDKHQQKRMRDKAALLSICQLEPNIYQVWGGEAAHILQVMPNGQVICDCRGWGKARHRNCSHVMKYRLVYGDLKK